MELSETEWEELADRFMRLSGEEKTKVFLEVMNSRTPTPAELAREGWVRRLLNDSNRLVQIRRFGPEFYREVLTKLRSREEKGGT